VSSSSTSSSFSGDVLCDILIVCDVEWRVPSPGVLPVPKIVICVTARGSLGSTAAFFKESIRRDAMIGTKIGCILC
jgi:hypothetical protein